MDGEDVGRAYERAVEAFGRNGFLVLVGDRQIEELDEEFELGSATEVTCERYMLLSDRA
ncbi:hypothetical protein HRW07_23385 [Streptomyces lunaelactis]|uniref:hypothetical protein n=1 Tax=Streptomyces lunaelactis TaxID=1535768 RepID=UPI0015856CEB|nr:hypothetical protein [Streptomyces lunaelactis]NUL06117.1 hypothetical protein [Streptomyces lunaelactis]